MYGTCHSSSAKLQVKAHNCSTMKCPSKNEGQIAVLDKIVMGAADKLHTSGSLAVLPILILSVLILVAFSWKRFCRKIKTEYLEQDFKENDNELQERRRRRKKEFLRRAGEDYGYRSSPAGFIDEWRQQEFPNLISPAENWKRNANDYDDEKEVYLDYAGSALPSRSLLQAVHEDAISRSSILANPHSSGPAASRTSRLVDEAKKDILDHFNGHPGRFSSACANDMSELSPRQDKTPQDWFHPGYDIVFTSGATEAIKVVSENFPWSNGENSPKSTLIYPHNAHTSVIGMRGPVLAKGGNFICRNLQEIMQLADCTEVEDFDEVLSRWGHQLSSIKEDSNKISCERSNNLLVLPAECNFGGDRPSAKLIQTIRRLNERRGFADWLTMLDLAKAASTGPVNLKELDPDFACVSFYKIFGYPTGLGVLFVRRTATTLFTQQKRTADFLHQYFGGGSVDMVVPALDIVVGRGLGKSSVSSSLTSLAFFHHGTMHFRGIISLRHGFDEIDRLGGMKQIQKHTRALAAELARRLKLLRHGNSQPVVLLYGAWGQKYITDCGPTIAFNIVRNDGNIVGYNEVSKLAALNHPPLQLRTGCFCNPGACQYALKISDTRVQENYREAGHVCGDHNDIIDGKATGAVRASFGKDSIWEDLDVLIKFIERHFVNRALAYTTNSSPEMSQQREMLMRPTLLEMYIFPIKSCAAQRVKKWKISLPSGRLLFDREFALIDTTGMAMRLQKFPKMATIQPHVELEKKILTISAPGFDDLVLSLEGESTRHGGMNGLVNVCGNQCSATLWADIEASNWFSEVLGVECFLARYSNGGYAARNGTKPEMLCDSSFGRRQGFPNDKPILLISKHAVDELNIKLKMQNQALVSSRHFRPNFVVECGTEADIGAIAHPEDGWERIEIGNTGVVLEACGHCARCAMVDVDPTTGRKGKTLRALADYRRVEGNINFGVFLQGEAISGDDEKPSECWVEEGLEMLCK